MNQNWRSCGTWRDSGGTHAFEKIINTERVTVLSAMNNR